MPKSMDKRFCPDCCPFDLKMIGLGLGRLPFSLHCLSIQEVDVVYPNIHQIQQQLGNVVYPGTDQKNHFVSDKLSSKTQ